MHVRFLHSETVYKRIWRVKQPITRRVALWIKKLFQKNWYCNLR